MTTNADFRRLGVSNRKGADCYEIRDANGFRLATVHCRDDLQKWSFGHSHLTSDEARRIANAIARLPELLMQRRGFYSRGGGHDRWKPGYVGAIAFSRTGDPATGNYGDATVIQKFGDLPEDLSAL